MTAYSYSNVPSNRIALSTARRRMAATGDLHTVGRRKLQGRHVQWYVCRHHGVPAPTTKD